MFGLGKHTDGRVYFAVIDIGSGSVAGAIFLSESDAQQPTHIWSYRDYVPIGDATDITVPLKEVTTSLVNIFLKLGNEGVRALHEVDPSAHIAQLQIGIAAPWSYTVTKNITYKEKGDFEVTEKLIHELTDSAIKAAKKAAKESGIFASNHLAIVDTNVTGVLANGYVMPDPIGINAKEIEVAITIGVVDKKLLEIIRDSHTKLLPRAKLTLHPFMFMYFEQQKRLQAAMAEVCLVDITSEATEVAIVRDGILTHVTHMPIGQYTIAREIAAACGIPKEEAYAYLKNGVAFTKTKLPAARQTELENVITAYEARLAKLFLQTGDVLAIPKSLFLHTELNTEKFFTERVQHAAKQATNSNHNIHPITSALLADTEVGDTAIAVSARYLHRQLVG